MATRFYLPSSGTAPVSPAFDAAWNDTSAVTRRPTSTTKGASAFVEVTDPETSALNTWNVCLGQFVSAPLDAQTITGTVKGIIRGREDNAAANARSQMVVKVVSADGATVRGTLIPQNTTTTNINEWVVTTTATAARNARFPVGSSGTTVTSVAAQKGDRIVIEVGARAVNTSTTSYTMGLRFGENATDAAENETGTTEAAPWVEFSQNLVFSTDVESTVTFQQGVGGYTGTVDTWLEQNAPNTSHGSDLTLVTGNAYPTAGLSAHTLLRFENIFGTGPGQVPPTATIISANLTVNVTDASLQGYSIFRMVTPWTPSTTWSSMGNGVEGDDVFQYDASTSGFSTGLVTFSILPAFQWWFGGATNMGVCLYPDGADTSIIHSSKNTVPPKLTVVYSAPPGATALNVTASAAAKKPALAATATAGAISPRSVSATAQATKPSIAVQATTSAASTSAFSSEFSFEFGGTSFANPALKFDNDTGHVRYPLVSSWYFPDADWTVGIVASIANPAGSASQYLISTGAYGGTQSFNLLAYEAGSGTPGRIECNIRGSGSAISVVGANDVTLINSDWRLWIVERVKATETFNIYYVPVNGTRTLYSSASSVGFDGSTSTTPTAIATRAPPVSNSLRWMDGSIHSVFKVDGLLTAGEMQSLGSGVDLITGLGRSPVVLTRLKDLTSPIPNSGSDAAATGTINGGVVVVEGPAFGFSPPVGHTISATAAAPKPAIAASSTQTSIARAVTTAAAASKPSVASTATQTFPARAVAGAVAAKKPTAAAVAVQTFPARAVVASVSAKKPTSASTATQVFPARAVTAAAPASKPTASAAATQTFPARAVIGVAAATKPAASAAVAQVFPARAVAGSASASKPTISAASTQTSIVRSVTAAASAPRPAAVSVATQTFPARSLVAAAVSPKPMGSGIATQTFPARSLAGAASAPKPVANASAAQVFPGLTVAAAAMLPKPTAAATVNSSRRVQVTAAAKKPTAAAAVAQTFPARNVAGGVAAKKPSVTATAAQVFPARAVAASAVAAKPTAIAFAQQEFPERFVEALFEAPKPTAAAAAVQSTIGSVSVFGTAESPKPAASATAAQVFPDRFVTASAPAPKPTAAGIFVSTRRLIATAAAPKPTAAATVGQVFPARTVSGAASVKKPMLTASATHPYPAHIVSVAASANKPYINATAIQVRGVQATASAPKPTAAATAAQVFPPRFLVASAAAPKPSINVLAEQVFPARDVDGIAYVTKPTIRVFATHGPSPGAAHIANTVHLSGFIDYEQRFSGSIDMDVLIAGAIETDIALTGFIEE